MFHLRKVVLVGGVDEGVVPSRSAARILTTETQRHGESKSKVKTGENREHEGFIGLDLRDKAGAVAEVIGGDADQDSIAPASSRGARQTL